MRKRTRVRRESKHYRQNVDIGNKAWRTFRVRQENWKRKVLSKKKTRTNTMDDTLQGLYKELWREYQNQEAIEIKDLSMEQLVQRIQKWEEIEFEARSKRQKCLAEKRTRDEEAKKVDRDSLITNPRYAPPDAPSQDFKPKVRQARRSKEDKLTESLGDIGVDLGDLMKEVAAKKKAGVQDSLINKIEGEVK